MGENALTAAKARQSERFNKLLESGDFYDCVVKCAGQEIKAVKAILASQCDFFAGCFKRGFAEAESSVVNLEDDPPDAVQVMIRFLYGSNYDIPHNIDVSGEAALHAEVYALARKYDISPLADFAKSHFKRLPLAASMRSDEAKGYIACIKAANIIYKTTPQSDRGLRDVVVTFVKDYHPAIFSKDSGNEKIFEESPEFALDVAKTVVKGNRWEPVSASTLDEKACPDCGQEGHIIQICEPKFPDESFLCLQCNTIISDHTHFHSCIW